MSTTLADIGVFGTLTGEPSGEPFAEIQMRGTNEITTIPTISGAALSAARKAREANPDAVVVWPPVRHFHQDVVSSILDLAQRAEAKSSAILFVYANGELCEIKITKVRR